MHIPEACAQIDGPGEATRQSAWPEFTEMPQKHGKTLVSAAFQPYLATRFRGRLYPGLLYILHYKYLCRRSREGHPETTRVFFSYFSKFLHGCNFRSMYVVEKETIV